MHVQNAALPVSRLRIEPERNVVCAADAAQDMCSPTLLQPAQACDLVAPVSLCGGLHSTYKQPRCDYLQVSSCKGDVGRP